MVRIACALGLMLLVACQSQARNLSSGTCSVLVYGATSSGVIASVAAARAGCRVVLLEAGAHVGGMSAAGLGATDVGVAASIGGISREFYRRVGAEYGVTEKFEFEPHVAEKVFLEMLAGDNVTLVLGAPLTSVAKSGPRIVSVSTKGMSYDAAVFIDATYEGDLMAMAGVNYTVGREANSTYGETLNGFRDPWNPDSMHVDPYIVPGDPASGLLPHVTEGPVPWPPRGTADGHVQAYTFRLCLTANPANRITLDPPDGYDPAQYELVARWVEAIGVAHPVRRDELLWLSPLPNGKFDANNSGYFSIDLVGGADLYPDADEATRSRIRAAHEAYERGFIHFLRTDPRIPADIRAEIATYGLCADEFKDNNGWPHAIYAREARRMIGSYVMTESNVLGKVNVQDPVGLGSYAMDSHFTQRVAVENDARVEGGFGLPTPAPYPISFRALLPNRNETTNILVPVGLSASHVAYGSLRMEPVFMILGHAAGAAAALSASEGVAVQDVSYAALRAQLLREGQKLSWP